MGMFYCDNCKVQQFNGICAICGDKTRKYWWTFPKDARHPNVPHGFKVFYNPDGTIQREEEF